MDPVPTAIGYPAQLLVVLVQQRSRVAGDIAHRCSRQLVGVVEAVHAGPAQDITDGRAGIAGQVGEAMGPIAGLDAGGEDGFDRRARQGPG